MSNETTTNDSLALQLDPCDCGTKHPLERDGTSQAQRVLKALDPSSVAVDERNLSDLLVFARSYAKLLNFHTTKPDAKGQPFLTTDGNWDVFLRKDITMLIAEVSRENVQALRDTFRLHVKAVTASPSAATLRSMLLVFRDLLKRLDSWYRDSDPRTLFPQDLGVFYQSVFLDGYRTLFAIDGGATAIGQAGGLGVFTGFTFNTTWAGWLSENPAVADPLLYEGDTTSKQIMTVVRLLQRIFEKFAGTLQLIIGRTPVYLEKTISEYPYHKAHMGLFLAFLELFAYAQQHLNRITERHLNFFYQEVLQLTPKAAVADKVHVIFELAKNAAGSYKIDTDTLLKAGKDETGVDLFYGTDKSIVVNKAKVALFKNLFIDRVETGGETVTALFASPKANSADGIGAELDKTVPQWKAFGSSQQGKETEDRTMPEATVGFAIASPQLLVAEGERHITLTFVFSPLSPDDTGITRAMLETKTNYSFALTSPKAWIAPVVTSITLNPDGSGNFISMAINLSLDSSMPAVTPHSFKTHGGTFNTADPVLKVGLLNFAKSGNAVYGNNLYAVFQNAIIKQVDLSVSVSGMQNLVLHNEFSKIDPSKPFMPFGQQPKLGSPFYIGSKEIFFKKVSAFSLEVDWHGAPADMQAHYANYKYDFPTVATNTNGTTVTNTTKAVNVSNATFEGKAHVLNNGAWPKESDTANTFTTVTESGTGGANRLFETTSAKTHVKFVFSNLHTTRASAIDNFDENLLGSTRGYLRIGLAGSDFFHDIFPMALAKQALLGANGFIPPSPYTPIIKTFSAGYVSPQTLDNTYDQLYHIHPFGEQRIDIIPSLAEQTSRYLFPQFVTRLVSDDTGQESRKPQKGMLFIGLEGVVPQQSLSMLVQVVDDSGNHNVQAPPVNWSYLRDNEWVSLTRQQVSSDTSNGFQTSGIVELDIPADATSTNTILPSGYHWLRASAEEYTDSEGLHDPSALNNVLNIIAQAAPASFRENGNDPAHLAGALDAGKIAKFAVPAAAVKGVTQPYASFGGKTAEQGNNYYRRVSERLRHKGRAISMWDYERLVLENFPSIYKVKCISHTRDVPGMTTCYSELSPGKVCVTVVSNLLNQNEVDPLRPTTGINTRNEIKAFLKKRASGFAKIEVINPDYEAIQVKCNVIYMPEYQKDKGFYDGQLIEDIKRFLSPWAFKEGSDIVFGGKMHSSYIINFIEERYYVDYLTDFEMFKQEKDDSGNTATTGPLEEISATFAKTILVSAETHLINPEII